MTGGDEFPVMCLVGERFSRFGPKWHGIASVMERCAFHPIELRKEIGHSSGKVGPENPDFVLQDEDHSFQRFENGVRRHIRNHVRLWI